MKRSVSPRKRGVSATDLQTWPTSSAVLSAVEAAVLGSLIVLLGGCAASSRPITIAQALRELQDQLQAAGAVSPTGAAPEQFAAAARRAQCEAHDANPAVPFLAHEITIDLTGSFTATGGFAVGPAITGGPPFGVSGSLARGQTQALALPLTFAALSDLPDVVTAQRASLLTALPPRAKAAGMERLLNERDALRGQTIRLISTYDTAECSRAR